MANTGMMTACGLSLKFRARMPRAFHDVKQAGQKGLKALQVGKGAQRRLTDAEMKAMEQSETAVSRPKRLTPLKIAL